MKELNTLSTLEYFSQSKVKPKDDFQRPMDQIPSKKSARGVFGVAYTGDRHTQRKVLNLNIYKSKNILLTKDDDYHGRRVGLKELLFYMQKDPLMKKTKVYYQSLVKNI